MMQDMCFPCKTKQCSACHEHKPLTDFYKHRDTKDGHRGKCKACWNKASKKWSREHPDSVARSRKRFLASHVEHLHAYEAKRWEVDREHMSNRNRQWRQAHPLQRAQNEAKRRAKLKGCDIDTVDYAAILERDGWHCYLCDCAVSPENLTFDHVVPLRKGGCHAMDNIKVAHRSCNSRKGQRLLSEIGKA